MVVQLRFLLPVFGVRVSVTFHLMFVHIILLKERQKTKTCDSRSDT